ALGLGLVDALGHEPRGEAGQDDVPLPPVALPLGVPGVAPEVGTNVLAGAAAGDLGPDEDLLEIPVVGVVEGADQVAGVAKLADLGVVAAVELFGVGLDRGELGFGRGG